MRGYFERGFLVGKKKQIKKARKTILEAMVKINDDMSKHGATPSSLEAISEAAAALKKLC